MSWLATFFKSIYIRILLFLFACQILFLSIFVFIDYAFPPHGDMTDERVSLAMYYLDSYMEKTECDSKPLTRSNIEIFEPAHTTWLRLASSNPNLWYHYISEDCQFNNNKQKKQFELDQVSISTNPTEKQCTEASSFFNKKEHRGNYLYFECDGNISNYTEIGGLSDSFEFPLLARMDFLRGSAVEAEMIAKSYIVMLLAMPIVILLFLHPIRRVSHYASKISPLSRGVQLPTKGIFSEVSGLIKAVNLALKRLDEGHDRERYLRNAIAHELKTPLTCMRTDLEEIEDDDLRKRLISDVRRMDKLIEQILQFARTAARIECTETFDLVKEVKLACAEAGINAITHGKQINFINNLENNSTVNTNKSVLFLILVNLLNNAILHSQTEKAIDVKISKYKHKTKPKAFIRYVEIRDYGIGLDTELLKRINEDLTDGLQHSSLAGKGFGLNLVIELVQLAGLSLNAENQTSGGVKFTLTIPL